VSLSVVTSVEALPAATLARLSQGAYDARDTMAPETGRALRRAFTAFQTWSSTSQASPLPADPATVARYVDHLASIPGRKASGIRQAVWAIGSMHRLGEYPDPTKVEVVRLALKRMARQLGTRQQQAAPIGSYEVRRMVETSGSRPVDLRDVALLLTMRDLLARRSEIVSLDVVDIALDDTDGTGIATIRRSKTDQTGEGVELFLSARAVGALRAWLDVAGITEGAIFRSVNKGGNTTRQLDSSEVPRIFKRLALRAGLSTHVVEGISGHSCRVGMAQDLVASGADLPGVMQAGRWKSSVMPARYSARLSAKRGAVARLHDLEG
jgi:site-specific recombinase XerD